MPQIWNFSAGPGMLPHSVLEAAQKEFLDYRGLGASIVEMSHRTHAVEAIVESLTEELRGLLSIPEEFEIFFTQGGKATHMYSNILSLHYKKKDLRCKANGENNSSKTKIR